MTILVGNVGSGKSTYAKSFANLEGKAPIVINQDTLGSREKCIREAEFHMKDHYDILIDRTNINKKQRSYWINLAKKYNYEVEVVEFKISKELAFQRVKNRPNHPTIKDCSDEKILSIIERFLSSYEPPSFSEGFISHTIFHVDELCRNNQGISN